MPETSKQWLLSQAGFAKVKCETIGAVHGRYLGYAGWFTSSKGMRFWTEITSNVVHQNLVICQLWAA